MNVTPASQPPHGTLTVRTDSNRQTLTRAVKAGRAMRLAPGLYVVDATLPVEQVVRHHLFSIIAAVIPGGVICGRSALAGNPAPGGNVYVGHSQPARKTSLAIPGYTIVPLTAPGPLPGDMLLPGGIHQSGIARSLLENIDLQGRPAAFRAGTKSVEDKIDDIARTGGHARLQAVLNEVDVIAGSFDSAAVELVKRRIRPLLGTHSRGAAPASSLLRARLAGRPFDAHRVAIVERLVGMLSGRAPVSKPTYAPESRWEWLPFFEAYFSNFIEGTEFGVDEARRIAVEGYSPAARPADAHDVAATYRLASDRADAVRTPTSGEALIEILRDRHRVLMAVRSDKRPGELKEVANYAGGYKFVDPELVEGTLIRGFDEIATLTNPLFRAIAMMVLVTECHPFDDGNGRVARLTANAELSSAGQVRIVIPTVFRGEYLSALSALSNGNGSGESLLSVLEFAQKWAAEVDWSSYHTANDIIQRCNAYVDPSIALAEGRRLLLPS